MVSPESDRRAWAEYLAWTANASPREYELTERLAWRRLQDALMPQAPPSRVIVFEPAEGFPGDFAPEE